MATTERTVIATPLQAFGGRAIVSPFQFTTDENDTLEVVVVNAVAGVTLAIHGRRVDSKGEIVPLAETMTPTSDRTVTRRRFPIGRGALLNLTVFASAGAPVIGQTFVIVNLLKGFTGATVVLGTLIAGPVTATQPLGFPGSAIESSIQAPSAVRTFQVADPGAGANWTTIVPAGARWELVAATWLFVTDANVANRLPVINLVSTLGAGLTKAQSFPQVSIVANSNVRVTFARGLTPSTVATVAFMAALPADLPLFAGDSVNATTVNLQAGDQYQNITVTVREWLDF